MAPRNLLIDGQQGIEFIWKEFIKATTKHGNFKSAHEGYAVLLEEMDELKAEVWKRDKDPVLLQKEAIQVGAMALRFLVDITIPILAKQSEAAFLARKEEVDAKGKQE